MLIVGMLSSSGVGLEIQEVVSVQEENVATVIEMELPNVSDNSFKTYMSYTAITNRNSLQWKMQQEAVTTENGFRLYEDRYMIAVGTYYADRCGIKLNVHLENGNIIYCITGDIKQNIHTDASNRYVPANGNVVEFIVDTNKIDTMARRMGNMSYSENFYGQIVKIELVEEKENV